VKIIRWNVGSDDKSMRVRFDNMRGCPRSLVSKIARIGLSLYGGTSPIKEGRSP
jgi:hypothetical protein